jgi:hypothetical protein
MSGSGLRVEQRNPLALLGVLRQILLMNWTATLTVATTVVGSLLAVIGASFTWTSYRRAQYDRILAETARLTSGKVGNARHLVGSYLESSAPKELPDDVIKAVFIVLWAFERLDGLYVSMESRFRRSRPSKPQRLLLTAIRGEATSWGGYLSRSYVDEQGTPVNTVPSDTGVKHLASQLKWLSS